MTDGIFIYFSFEVVLYGNTHCMLFFFSDIILVSSFYELPGDIRIFISLNNLLEKLKIQFKQQ